MKTQQLAITLISGAWMTGVLVFGLPGCKGERSSSGTAQAGSGGLFTTHPQVFNAMPDRAVPRPLQAQLAYNVDDGVFYGHFSWPAQRDHLDAFYRFENGTWVLRGQDARSIQKSTQLKSAQSRFTIAWNDADSPAAVPNFEHFGCALACHDESTHMPNWAEEGLELPSSMRLPDPNTYPLFQNIGLDFWAWRAHSTSPIGYWQDQFMDSTQPLNGAALQDDLGPGGPFPNPLIGGNPTWAFDPDTTQSGRYAIPYANLTTADDYYFQDALNPSLVAGVEAPETLAYADAVTSGYVPQEGDTIPYWVLSAAPMDGKGDVLAVLSPDAGATVSKRSFYDQQTQRWHVYFSRNLTTGDFTDMPFQVGNQYTATFAMHSDGTAGRDHYITFPYVFWMEDPNQPGGETGSDFRIIQITGAGSVPDFDDMQTHPLLELDMFLPGLISLEYLGDLREAQFNFGQRHGGADIVALGLITTDFLVGCRDCHVVRADDPQAPFTAGGPLELRTPRRGGLFEATPSGFRDVLLPTLEARCTPCHAPGGTASTIAFQGVNENLIYSNIITPGRVAWQRPNESPLLNIPSDNLDGLHPPEANLLDFKDSEDFRKILYWILYNGPNN